MTSPAPAGGQVRPETPGVPLVRPFAGLRPAPGRAAEVAAPPYDVMTTEEARERARGRPWSFLHVSRPEIDLPPGADPRAPEAYAKAAENMRRMLEAGVLRRDGAPRYYVYRLTAGDHVQTGVVAAAAVAAYEGGRIRRHESTRPATEDDRVRQIEAVGAHTGLVLVAHRPSPEVAEILGRAAERPADCAFTADDGVGHAVWTVADAPSIERLTKAMCAIEALYIADGHHRSAAAARVAAGRRAANPGHRGDEPYNFFPVAAFPSDEVRILPYNRVVRDLNGMTAEAFLARLGEGFAVEPGAAPAGPGRRRAFGMYLAGRWYRLVPHREVPRGAGPLARLDVSVLSETLLGPVLAVGDSRTDARIGFVSGAGGPAELERRVDSGEMAVAFALNPTTMDELMAVADAAGVMPPKCTWFEPKLADGLVSHPLA